MIFSAVQTPKPLYTRRTALKLHNNIRTCWYFIMSKFFLSFFLAYGPLKANAGAVCGGCKCTISTACFVVGRRQYWNTSTHYTGQVYCPTSAEYEDSLPGFRWLWKLSQTCCLVRSWFCFLTRVSMFVFFDVSM